MRPKTLADESMPSGNGVAAFALQRLGHLIGEHRYIDAAERALRNAWKAMDEYPHGHVTLLTALEENLTPPGNRCLARRCGRDRHLAALGRQDLCAIAHDRRNSRRWNWSYPGCWPNENRWKTRPSPIAASARIASCQ